MRSRFDSLFLVCFCFLAERATSQDSVRTEIVVPGVVHTRYERTGPLSIHVLTIDLREESILITTYRPDSLTYTSVQASQNDRPGHRVIAATNADFFSFQTHQPIGNQVADGEMMVGVRSRRSHFALGGKRKPFIESFSFSGSLATKAGIRFRLDAVNQKLGYNSIVFYNSYWNNRPPISNNVKSFLVQVVEPQWLIAETLRVTVERLNSAIRIPLRKDEGMVCAREGSGLALVKSVAVHDTLRLFFGFEPAVQSLTQVVGGGGRILGNGKKVFSESARSERIGENFIAQRHPRTFVAFDRDSTHLFLCTVDGRQENSRGMNFEEMADFLLSIGAWNAINLDGGGSTTMVIRGKVVNSPSDKSGERPVANSIQVISTQ